MRELKATTEKAEGQLSGDRAVIESGFPPLFIQVMTIISMTVGTNVALRVGNPPRIGFGDDSKPMGIKQNTGAAFLFKGLIPTNRAFLKQKSEDVEIKIKNSDPEMTYSEYYGTSQLRVTLNDVLSDAKSYEHIVEKNGKLYLYPKGEVIDKNHENFKHPDTVKNTVFVIDLKNCQEPVIDQEKLLSQLPKFKQQFEKIEQPSWWKAELGDFSRVKFQSMPVSSCLQAELNLNQAPQPFLVLGGPNAKAAKGKEQRAITGDVDLFWVVSQIQSLARQIPDSAQKFDLSSRDQRREFAVVFTQVAELMQESVLGEKGPGIRLDELKIEGYTNPSEAAMIYMVNKLFGAEGVKIAQLILHGSEVYNPGKPSEIGPLLHILPTGERILTRNEDQLIALVLSHEYLATYPIDVHPKWNMEKWAPVIEAKIALNQPINPETKLAYDEHKVKTKVSGLAAAGQALSGTLGGLFVGSRSRSNSVANTPPGTPETLRKRGDTLSASNRQRASSVSDPQATASPKLANTSHSNRPTWTSQGTASPQTKQSASSSDEEKKEVKRSGQSPKF